MFQGLPVRSIGLAAVGAAAFVFGSIVFAAPAEAGLCAQRGQGSTCIDNGLTGVGAWGVLVDDGGGSETGWIIASDGNSGANGEDVIYDLYTMIDFRQAGGDLYELRNETITQGATRQSDGSVTSAGTVTDTGGTNRTINWSSVSSIAAGSSAFRTQYTFTSGAQFGTGVRVLQYFDQDVRGSSSDNVIIAGTAAANNQQILTTDVTARVGVSHYTNQSAATGATFLGSQVAECCDEFGDQTYTTAVRNSSTDPLSNDGVGGDPRYPNNKSYGYDNGNGTDATDTIAYQLSPAATRATIVFIVGGSANGQPIVIGGRQYAPLGAATGLANPTAAGTALDALPQSGDALALLGGLDVLSDAQATNSVSQIAGNLIADAIQVGVRANQLPLDAVMNRLAQGRGAVAGGATTASLSNIMLADASGDLSNLASTASTVEPSKSLWFQGIGEFGDTDTTSTSLGYSQDIAGFVVGFDRQFNPALRLGGAFGYTHSNLSDDLWAKGDIDSYTAALYGEWRRDALYVNGAAAISWNDYDSTRNVTLGSGVVTAKGSAQGNNYSLQGKAGYIYEIGRFTIDPSLGVRYMDVNRDSFTEDGSSLIDMRVADTNEYLLQFQAGAAARTRVEVGGYKLVPEARAYLLRDEGDAYAPSVGMNLFGVGFTTIASRVGRTAGQFGVGVGSTLSERLDLAVGYDVEVRDNATSNTFGARLRWTW
jgi:outer membrane autotransporter protein